MKSADLRLVGAVVVDAGPCGCRRERAFACGQLLVGEGAGW